MWGCEIIPRKTEQHRIVIPELWDKVSKENKKLLNEYFGLYSRNQKSKIVKKYTRRTRDKIKLLYKYNVIDKCIFIFPWDIKNKILDEIFNPYLSNKINIA